MIATVGIDAIAAGGDGVGRHEGLVVFVPRTAPGDRVRVNVTPRGRFARSLPLEIVSPSPERVEPPCAHYVRDACGGCQIQHMSYTAQLTAKQRIVSDALQRIGRREAPLPFIRKSPDEWRYRRKLTLAIRRRGSRWIAGLHRFDDPGRVFPLADCPITRREVVRVWQEVLAAAEYFPEGRRLRGSVRETDGGFSFTLLGGRRWNAHEALFAQVPALTSVWWHPEGGDLQRMHAREHRPAQSGGDAADAGASFVQVNRAVAEELHRHVVSRARAYAPSRVLDAYAGAGSTAVALAQQGVAVTAVELDRHAAAVAAGRLRTPSTVLVGRVEDHVQSLLPADVVLLNPPRVGIAEVVSSVLNDALERPRALLYVSCNPATLARDLSRLSRYRVDSLVCFDMFPQTAHVETVCELVPAE